MPHLKFQSFVVMLPLLVVYAPECLGLNKLNPTYTQGYALWLAGFTVSILQDCFPLLFVFFPPSYTCLVYSWALIFLAALIVARL